MERLPGSRATSSPSYRLLRAAVSCFVLPFLMLPGNIRLLWSLRGSASALISRRSSGAWKKFSLRRRIWFIVHPGNQELWLRWSA